MNRFELVRAGSAAQAKELFAAKSGTVYKAGGIDVLDHLKERLVELAAETAAGPTRPSAPRWGEGPRSRQNWAGRRRGSERPSLALLGGSRRRALFPRPGSPYTRLRGPCPAIEPPATSTSSAAGRFKLIRSIGTPGNVQRPFV